MPILVKGRWSPQQVQREEWFSSRALSIEAWTVVDRSKVEVVEHPIYIPGRFVLSIHQISGADISMFDSKFP